MRAQKAWSVQIEHLSVSFGDHDIVREASLLCPDKGISILLGRSGSGKTTLLRSLNRLNEEFPGCRVTGRARLDLGQGPRHVYPAGEADSYSLRELRQSVGMVFQTPQVFPVSILRNMTIPLEVVAGCPQAEKENRMERALKAADLWDEVKDRLNLNADRLSGGQQQRLCLARALALEPSLLLLDEPTASLDVHASRHVEDLLLRLAADYPILMVSHSPRQGLKLANRLAVMSNGRVLMQTEDVDALTERDVEAMLAEDSDSQV
ncbi:MAG: phosphate ABC transporter ATP-binding protein [Desulfovibrionaceae bacterium]|nr:phosphate ABC transporter ATP-binding protein [Desulfovibrionaceae bacterium]